MKTIRNFFCNTEPFFLTMGGCLILFFGTAGGHAVYVGKFLEYLSLLGFSLGFVILLMALVAGITALIAWLQSHC